VFLALVLNHVVWSAVGVIHLHGVDVAIHNNGPRGHGAEMVLKHEDRVAWEEGSLADTLECFPKRARQCRSLMFTWADAGGNSLSLPREPTFASPPSNLIIKSEQNQGAAERIKAVQFTWNINSTFVDVLVCAARRAT